CWNSGRRIRRRGAERVVGGSLAGAVKAPVGIGLRVHFAGRLGGGGGDRGRGCGGFFAVGVWGGLGFWGGDRVLGCRRVGGWRADWDLRREPGRRTDCDPSQIPARKKRRRRRASA